MRPEVREIYKKMPSFSVLSFCKHHSTYVRMVCQCDTPLLYCKVRMVCQCDTPLLYCKVLMVCQCDTPLLYCKVLMVSIAGVVLVSVVQGKPFATDQVFDFAQEDIIADVKSMIPTMLKYREQSPPTETYSLHRKVRRIAETSARMLPDVFPTQCPLCLCFSSFCLWVLWPRGCTRDLFRSVCSRSIHCRC